MTPTFEFSNGHVIVELVHDGAVVAHADGHLTDTEAQLPRMAEFTRGGPAELMITLDYDPITDKAPVAIFWIPRSESLVVETPAHEESVTWFSCKIKKTELCKLLRAAFELSE